MSIDAGGSITMPLMAGACTRPDARGLGSEITGKLRNGYTANPRRGRDRGLPARSLSWAKSQPPGSILMCRT